MGMGPQIYGTHEQQVGRERFIPFPKLCCNMKNACGWIKACDWLQEQLNIHRVSYNCYHCVCNEGQRFDLSVLF